MDALRMKSYVLYLGVLLLWEPSIGHRLSPPQMVRRRTYLTRSCETEEGHPKMMKGAHHHLLPCIDPHNQDNHYPPHTVVDLVDARGLGLPTQLS
ncbi:hypothetical protein I3842_11G078500 [Carya illinoinensis]|uniref:Uncharacterized protein n=1 Tax=Carya illinoinensis TaxID=32201 RepID=A0A922DN64_CARIL|nr:hypothetical protein I3842_11G078500 [Carya illinoinensis]